MRKNTANYIISLVGLTALNIVYFLWQPYPKSIIRLPLDVYGIRGFKFGKAHKDAAIILELESVLD